MKKILKLLAVSLILLIVVGLFWAYQNFNDRHPNYSLDLTIGATEASIPKVGFASEKITPQIPDKWTDANKDAQFNEADGDSFDDLNKNGKFDAYWLAGFQNKRPANGVHDDIWARATVIDDGKTKLAIVSVDVIGLGHKYTVDIRKKLNPALGIDYAVVCSTHNHEAPDVIGMWGEDYKRGVDEQWLEFVENQAVKAIEQATKNLRPAKLKFAEDATGARHLVNDTRPPKVLDPALFMMQAIDAETDSTLGTLVSWGNHPETVWNENLLITSDFPHYVRDGIEKGVFHEGKEIRKGLGGQVVYVSGCIGGLMTTDSDFAIKSIFDGKSYVKPTFEKVEAQGKELATLVIDGLNKQTSLETEVSLGIRAKTFEVPLENVLYKLGISLKVIDAGYSRWGWFRTEVANLQIGPAQMLLIPGEIYPEIVNGGIETPEGADITDKKIIETPPLRSLMKAKYKWVIGLANDEIGYIIPQSQWDVEAPFTYDFKERPYGEINSVGVSVAPIVHREAVNVLK
jgi:hypothetical protein